MRRLLWPIGLAALLSSSTIATAQPLANEPPPLTLEQAQSLAASRNPLLSAARHEVEAAAGAALQAAARRNPELTALVEDTGRAGTRVTTTTVGIPLELGGKREARMNAAQRQQGVAGAQLVEAESALRARVVARFFAVVVAQQRVRLAGDSARLASQAADMADKRVAAGKVPPLAASRAKVDAANASLEVADAQAELLFARQALASLWGDTQPRFAFADAPLDAPLPQPALDELMRRVDASPSLRAGRLEVDARLARVDAERSKAVPDVVVNVGAKRDNELGLTQAVVGVSVPLPFFDRNQGGIEEAYRRARKAEDEVEAARVELIAELMQASTQLSTARASLAVLQDTVLPAAGEAYRAASTGFEAGKFGFLDVIDAQRALLQARARHLNTLSSAYQAATTIDRLLGR